LKITPTCLSCILAVRALEIERISSDNAEAIAVFRDVLNTVGLYAGPHIELALSATMSFRRMKTSIGHPYTREYKERMYRISAEAAKGIRDLIESAETPGDALKIALVASALATRLEPGPHVLVTPIEPPTSVEVIGARLGRDDSNEVLKRVRTGMTVFFVTSSVGELPFDELLLEILGDEYSARTIVFVRGSEFQDFVTIEDVEYTKLKKVADQIVNMGSDAATIIREEVAQFYERLKEADLVIVKGLLQTLYVYNNPLPVDTLALFYTPCKVVEKVLGTPINTVNIYLRTSSEQA